MQYNYLQHETHDILVYLKDNYRRDRLMERYDNNPDRIFEELTDVMYACPGIMGNEHEPYFGLGENGEDPDYAAEECLAHNLPILEKAVEFARPLLSDSEIKRLLRNPCFCDMLIRVYLFPDALKDAMELFGIPIAERPY